jgi:hypothetical protein
MAERKLEIETLKKEELSFGSSVVEISRTKIQGREMLSFAKFYKDSSGEKKYPKSFAVPFDLRDDVIAAIKKVAE